MAREPDLELTFRKPPSTLPRLKRLVRAGYRPEYNDNDLEALWLKHPSKKAEEVELILYDDGKLVGGTSSSDLRIEADADLDFERAVPRPTFWESTAEFRANVYAWCLLAAWIVGFVYVANLATAWVKLWFQ